MKKQQIILVTGGAALLIVLVLFARTLPKTPASSPAAQTEEGHQPESAFDIKSAIATATAQLSTPRQVYLNSMQSAVVRGDVKEQQIRVYQQLASFWKDSVPSPAIYAYYSGQASKLENSKKSLNFAARLFLDNLRGVEDPASKTWMAGQGRELFEKVLAMDPSDDSAKVGLGSCYIFGSPASDPQEVMQGVQKILEVARRDSTNMYAQLMLGIGGVVSGQFDKAIEHLNKVVNREPGNLEAVLTLAEAYERHGDKENAIKWYNASKKLLDNPSVLKVIDQRIKSLQ